MSTGMKKAGVMGWPVEHSLSPRLHGYWLKKHKIDADYTALPVQPPLLRDALKVLADQGFVGVNLTVPHKETAVLVVDELEPLAQRVLAINTVIVKPDGKLYGRNTDVYGFTQNLRAAGFQSGKIATLIGAGGAARGCVVALLDMGFEDIRVVNRTVSKAEALINLALGKIKVFGWDDARAFEDTELLINATTLGLKGMPRESVSLDALPPKAWVTDMVYTPLETDLLKNAALRGNKTVDGLGMLLHQARPAFEAFFGIDPEVTPELRAHVLEGLSC
jgi:shikimate dehydrogenase